MEVLISIFIIMFGLLGVAAVLPLGGRNVAEVVRADNSSACGTSALRDTRAWGVLDPYNWRWANFTASPSPVIAVPTQVGGVGEYYLPYGQSFAIDPLFLARAAQVVAAPGNNATDPRPQYFPYDPGTPNHAYWQLVMPRVTLALQNDGVPPAVPQWAQHEAFYRRFFTWQDDVTFPLLGEVTDTGRPRQLYACSDGAGRVLPELPTSPLGAALPLVAETQGDYTWMAIVTPSFNESGVTWQGGAANNASVPANRRVQYSVQIVVSYKRDFAVPANYLATDEAPAERTVMANILSGGYGGGDVSLTVPVAAPDQYSRYLTLRKNQWIMLCGQVVVPNPADATQWITSNVYRWYRVVSPGEPPQMDATNTNWVRYVTLAGPDWNVAWCHRNNAGALDNYDGDTDNIAADAAAVIVDGVIGVYTVTVTIDRDLQMTILGQ